MKNIVRRNQKISRQPKHAQDRQEPLPQRHYAQVNHANGDVQHVHRCQPEKSSRKLRHARGNLGKLTGFLPRRLRKSRQTQSLMDELVPLHAMQNNKCFPEEHRALHPFLCEDHPTGGHTKPPSFPGPAGRSCCKVASTIPYFPLSRHRKNEKKKKKKTPPTAIKCQYHAATSTTIRRPSTGLCSREE